MNKNIKAGGDIHAGDGGYREGTQEEYENFAKGRNQSLTKMRIKQLAEQAGWDNHHSKFDTRIEKFAELIVKEMLQTCEDHPAWTGRMIGEKIKQHFGVEE